MTCWYVNEGVITVGVKESVGQENIKYEESPRHNGLKKYNRWSNSNEDKKLSIR